MWRENKPGFFILSILLLAMFWSIGYFIYSRTTGRFVGLGMVMQAGRMAAR